MKNLLFLVPIALFLVFSAFSSRLFAAGTVSPSMMVLLSIGLMAAIMMLFRPKAAKRSPITGVEETIRGEFAKDAFLDDPKKNAQFQAIVKAYSGNMPKSAASKLPKLQPLCVTDQERYAFARLSALVHTALGKYGEAARQYTTALVLHPTSDLAVELGACQQRLGELKKARESYQYAIDLDETNLDARCRLATAYVADRKYEEALEEALAVLDKAAANESALATAAICYGLLDEPLLYKRYTELAVENGYKQDKITETVKALKK